MTVVFDIKLMKVGCVLLQAAMGGDPSICRELDTKHWLTDITPDLKCYPITLNEREQLIAKLRAIR